MLSFTIYSFAWANPLATTCEINEIKQQPKADFIPEEAIPFYGLHDETITVYWLHDSLVMSAQYDYATQAFSSAEVCLQIFDNDPSHQISDLKTFVLTFGQNFLKSSTTAS